MEGVDIGILVLLLLPAALGLLYGVLNILFSVTAWALAAISAARLSHYFSPILGRYVDSALVGDILAFVGIFIISLMIFTALGYFISKVLGRTGLTAVDRLLGFVFGIGLGGAIVVTIVFLAGFTAITQRDWWQNAALIEPFQRVCVWGQRFLPEEVIAWHRYESNRRLPADR